MLDDDVYIEPEVASQLGDDGLSSVRCCLWAVDCQTCGRSLNGSATSVCVDDLNVATGRIAVASVHHKSCRPSCWGTSPKLGTGQFLSFRTQCVLLPDKYLGALADTATPLDSPRPFMMVNTSLEMIALERSAAGKWSLVTNTHHYLGMRRPGEAALDRPITMGSVTTDRDTVYARLGTRVWSAPGNSSTFESISAYGGITLVITSLFVPGMPGIFDSAEISSKFFSNGPCEIGWLRLAR